MSRRLGCLAECLAGGLVFLLLIGVCVYLWTELFCVVVSNQSSQELTQARVQIAATTLWHGEIRPHGWRIAFGFVEGEGAADFQFQAANGAKGHFRYGYFDLDYGKTIFFTVSPALKTSVAEGSLRR